jgi:hypothetical protein
MRRSNWGQSTLVHVPAAFVGSRTSPDDVQDLTQLAQFGIKLASQFVAGPCEIEELSG